MKSKLGLTPSIPSHECDEKDEMGSISLEDKDPEYTPEARNQTTPNRQREPIDQTPKEMEGSGNATE